MLPQSRWLRIVVLDNENRPGWRPGMTSNLQHTLASNIDVSSRRKWPILALAVFVSCAISSLGATPIETGTNIPAPALSYVPAQLSGRAPRTIAANPRRTFDRLGPQATERAVRSSLKVALVPDPLAMGALFFCAFALRWMKAQKRQSVAAVRSIAETRPALPRAA